MPCGRPIALVAAVAMAIAASGCGGGGDRAARGGSSGSTGGGSAGSGQGSTPAPARRAGPADPAAARVIRAWSDALRRGQIERATSYFALPSIVQNDTPPVTLNERAEVKAFNTSLPCGARLERAYRIGRYTAAVFRLTDRPGGDCGSGTGGEAATAFVIRRGRIREWRRLPDPQSGEVPPQPNPSSSSETPTGPTV
jgi:hypothetical protein